MFCLRSRVPASGFRVLRPQTTTPLQSIPSTTTSRLFSSALTRPLQTTTSTSTSPFRTPTITSLTSSPSATSSPFAAATQQSRSFSASASLGAKRNTYNPSRLVQKRRHGFLARLRTRGGRRVLIRRRQRGKKALSW